MKKKSVPVGDGITLDTTVEAPKPKFSPSGYTPHKKVEEPPPKREPKYTKQTLYERPKRIKTSTTKEDDARKRAKFKKEHRKVKTKQTLYEKPRVKWVPKKKRPGPTSRQILSATIPGYSSWVQMRVAQMAQFRNKLGFPDWRRTNIPNGMTKAASKRAWAEAKRKAKIDMDNLERAGLLNDDDIAREATEVTLTIMRSPVNADMKLKAATQLLNFYKAKPVSKSEMKLDAAEAWLAAIAQGEPEAEPSED
jgi:hypothetical protein